MHVELQPVVLRVRGLFLLTLTFSGTSLALAANSFIGPLTTVTSLSTTIPSNGDLNPYGVAQVPVTKGSLVAGSFLISNFNNGTNQQGTGTTIVEISPSGAFTLFAQIGSQPGSQPDCPGGIGLTTALVALRSGFVIVGSLPTMDGTSSTLGSGCLIVLNAHGKVVETITGNHLNGPWDMTAVDDGSLVTLFVTNVLSGTVEAGSNAADGGTIVRLLLSDVGDRPEVLESDIIGSGFGETTDPNALVIGPTGLAFDGRNGNLYVSDSLDNRIAAIPNALFRLFSAGPGLTVSSGGALNDPLGLTIAPNHNLIAANGDDGNLVEINPSTRQQVATNLVDNSGNPPGSGALFGLTATSAGVYFVDDATNTFNLLH
jgi:DNA-binding beta-propeller fold protein YncE